MSLYIIIDPQNKKKMLVCLHLNGSAVYVIILLILL